jgi:hypothetical protein
MIGRTPRALHLGNIALDGSKIKANASKHSALSYGHIRKREEQLKGEVRTLMALAEAADTRKISDGISLPERSPTVKTGSKPALCTESLQFESLA